MATICFLNRKGGVGKTSTCFHLAGTLAQLGRRVLLVDNDPQASLTQGFLGPDGMRALTRGETIASIYAGEDPLPDHVIRPVMPRVDLLAGSPLADPFNAVEPELTDRRDQDRLKAFLGDLEGRHDVTLIDCPPTPYLCAWAALVASSHVVIPLNPEDFGAQGIAEIQTLIERVRGSANPGLDLAGYLVTRINTRATVHKHYESSLRELFGDEVLTTMIPQSVDYLEAILYRKPVAAYKPKGAAAKAIKALVEELDARLAIRRAA